MRQEFPRVYAIVPVGNRRNYYLKLSSDNWSLCDLQACDFATHCSQEAKGPPERERVSFSLHSQIFQIDQPYHQARCLKLLTTNMSLLKLNAVRWTRELTWTILSLAAIIAIFVILFFSNGNPWPVKFITLNSVLAFLTTVAILPLHSALVSAITQLGWLHYRRPHSLEDFERFWQATHGIVGPLRLITLTKRPRRAVLGAMVILALLTAHTLVQQIVRNPEHVVDVRGLAKLPICTFYNLTSPGVSSVVPDPADSTVDAIANGQNNPTTVPFQPKTVCSTGNCTFSLAPTLAFHSKCIDVSTIIRKDCSAIPGGPNCIYLWPDDGPSLSMSNSKFNMSASVQNSDATDDDTRIFPDIPQQVVSVKAIALRQGEAYAQQCIIYPTVDQIQASVVNGILKEETISSWYNSTPIGPLTPTWILNPPSIAGGPFQISSPAVIALQSYLLNLYSGDIIGGPGQVIYSDGSDTTTMKRTYAAMQSDSLPNHFANVAQSMSYDARASQTSNGEPRTSANTVIGTATENKQYIHVEWLWFLLLVIVWLASAIFLLSVMHLTAKYDIGPYKTSIVAVMLAGPQGADRERLGRLDTSSQVHQVAVGAEYALHDLEIGLRFGVPTGQDDGEGSK
jgi:hypothetical protein